MSKIYIKTLEVGGIMPSLKGMRNPMNSWDKADTLVDLSIDNTTVVVGDNDMDLAKRLCKAGAEHRKYMRQIQVWCDVNMPRYWWSEADTYKFGTKNSCSTMHKLFQKDKLLTLDSFYYDEEDKDIIQIVINRINQLSRLYFQAKADNDNDTMNWCLVRAKKLLPESFIQLRTWNTNYEELMNMYHQRKHHRLKIEWVDTFCTWCESLPYFKDFCINDLDK